MAKQAVEDYTTFELVYEYYHTQDDDWCEEVYTELASRGWTEAPERYADEMPERDFYEGDSPDW